MHFTGSDENELASHVDTCLRFRVTYSGPKRRSGWTSEPAAADQTDAGDVCTS
jgi:hypothetical protein